MSPPSPTVAQTTAPYAAVAVVGAVVGGFAYVLPVQAHLPVLSIVGVVGLLPNFAVSRLHGVFDAVTNDVKDFDPAWFERVTSYVRVHRRALAAAQITSLIASGMALAVGQIINAITKAGGPPPPVVWVPRALGGTPVWLAVLCVVGYAALAVAILAAARLILVANQASDFRVDMLAMIGGERRRRAVLEEMRAAAGPSVKAFGADDPLYIRATP